MNDKKDAPEIMDDYLNAMEIHCLEGERGIAALNTLCRDLGYKDEGFRNGTSLEEFLKDNSGCCDAIVEWITEHLDKNEEWKDALTFEEESVNDNGNE